MMPSRLAVGLEAKKSSALGINAAPRVLLFDRQNFGSPALFYSENNFGDLILCKFIQKNNKKASFFFDQPSFGILSFRASGTIS
jgi:hypothetical protein